MKPFDLNEYLRMKEEGKEPKLVTRDGRSVRIICTDCKDPLYPIIALIDGNVVEYTASRMTNGCQFADCREGKEDIFFADLEPKKKKVPLTYENPNGDLSMTVPGKECTDETIDNIKYLRVRAGVRYWEDGYVNGEEDYNDGPKMPFARESGNWYIDIDTKTGRIKDWPQGVSARVHYKTCDDNTFYFINHNGTVIGEYDGYVPSCLAIDDDGWGDYIIFHIAANGKIEDWRFTQDDIDKIKQNAF